MNKKLKSNQPVKKTLNPKAVALILSCGVLLGSGIASGVNVYKLANRKIEIYDNFKKENTEYLNFINYEKQKYAEKVKLGEYSSSDYMFSVSQLESDNNVYKNFDKFATKDEKSELKRVNAGIITSSTAMAVVPFAAGGLYSSLDTKVGKLLIDKKQNEDEKEYF